jgi:hypothetical protein
MHRSVEKGEVFTFFIISPFLRSRCVTPISDDMEMKDEIKLSIAFLALNAGVIALVVSGYIKGGMNFGSVVDYIFK